VKIILFLSAWQWAIRKQQFVRELS
jgi:hypothetical protein